MEKAHFKLGCNFDFGLIEEVKKLNDSFENSIIVEFYGSDRYMAFITARPDFRLPDISKEHLEEYVKKSNEIGVTFNYTMNTIYPGSKRELDKKKNELIDFVHYLEDIGVKRITIANPIFLDIVREASKTISIEISTIAHTDTISQMKYYKDFYNVEKICGNLLKNRHIKFLKNAGKFCKDNNMMYEVMVNEFCSVNNTSYTTHCIYRDSCYLCHASNKTKEDALLLNEYPMKYCMSSRNMNVINWLRARFIRPEDIDRYLSIGINHFKITGRTGTTGYIKSVAEAYMSRKWDKNLLGLWKPLETIISGENELEFKQKDFIDNNKLNDFINYWFNNENFDCANEECGTTCKYCEEFYEKNIK